MVKSIKMFSSEDDVAMGRLPLHSLIVIALQASEKTLGTLVDKTGITDNTTAKELMDAGKIIPTSNLDKLKYNEHKSSLSIIL